MDEIEKIVLLSELSDEKCCCMLNHGPNTSNQDYKAVTFLVQSIGKDSENTIDLTIPICTECAEALCDDDMVLLYCLDCSQNQWLYKKFAKNKYRNKILWLKGCPMCSKKLGGIFFS